MFYYRQFNEDYFFKKLSENSESEALLNAYNLFEDGDIEKAHKLIDPLVLRKHPLALVLSSIYSNESEAERDFVHRHIDLLQTAAENKDPFALYSLGVYYDRGELLEENKTLAYECFKESAELGMPQSQYIYGTMLYYGTGGAELDIEKGLFYLTSASDQGNEDAPVLLKKIGEV